MAGSPPDRQQIIEVLVRYATGIDRRDWALFRSCFTSNVHADYGEGVGEWHDLEAFTDYMRVMHQDMGATQHMLSNFVIDLDGDTATASTYVHTVLVVTDDPPVWYEPVGRYDDHLVRADDGWRIAQRTFHHTRMTASPPLPT